MTPGMWWRARPSSGRPPLPPCAARAAYILSVTYAITKDPDLIIAHLHT
ncbi:hypothetical protein OG288_00720 [Streptomyces tauricus]|uniref:Uncharacterized protein n=1 Tax=Streptomyces tauricus TaxID=68274 RepID=A0ABZ1JAM1_9ACTN|nr:hypothetical protein [Streptomyces tauricus]